VASCLIGGADTLLRKEEPRAGRFEVADADHCPSWRAGGYLGAGEISGQGLSLWKDTTIASMFRKCRSSGIAAS